MRRRLVRLGDADQRLQLAGQRLLVLAAAVAMDQRLGRALDEDLGEPADLPPRLFARLAVRALDGRLQDDSAATRHQLAHPGQLAGFGVALVLGSGRADGEHLLDFFAVQDFNDFPQPPQAVGEPLGQRRLTGAAHAGQPDGEAAVRGPEIHMIASSLKKFGAQYAQSLNLARNMLRSLIQFNSSSMKSRPPGSQV